MSLRSRCAPPTARLRRRRFSPEPLEPRTLLTIFFTPKTVIQTDDDDGARMGVSGGVMPIYPIYWGSFWNGTGAPLRDSIQQSLDGIFRNSAYLDGLDQYGVHSRAGAAPNLTPVVIDADVSSTVSTSDITVKISEAVLAKKVPDSGATSERLYVVFTPPGTQWDEGDAAFHSKYVGLKSNWTPTTTFPQYDKRYFAWVGGSGGLDGITTLLSHEVVEAMTDAEGDAVQVLPRDSFSWNEIADHEAQQFKADLNGFQVQAYWSQRDTAFAVFDGNSQRVRVTTGSMSVFGDQNPVNTDDAIAVDRNSDGGVLATINGETFSLGPGQASGVFVSPGLGTNSVRVTLSQTAPVTFTGRGEDAVTVAASGVVNPQPVTINTLSHRVALTIDNTADTVSRVLTLANGQVIGVTGVQPNTVKYVTTDLTALTLVTGTGGSTVQVPATSALIPATVVSNGPDTVNVGDFTGLRNILGPLHVTGALGLPAVNLNDAPDTAALAVTLDTAAGPGGSLVGRITGLAPALITTGRSTVGTLTINGTPFADSVSVDGSVAQLVRLLTGDGDDTVRVLSSVGTTAVDGQGGTNRLFGPTLRKEVLFPPQGAPMNTWVVSGTNAGTLNGTVLFANVANLVGGRGIDWFQFGTGAAILGTLQGSGGDDWLEYTTGAPVAVDLVAGTATGTGGILPVSGHSSIRNVRAGNGGSTLVGDSQGNILVGGNGSDVIRGGSGRSVLIGGKGSDTLVGGAEDDILIGGLTTYAPVTRANDLALASILAEWQSAASYTLRIDHLRRGGGFNGSFVLVAGTTVIKDAEADVFTGAGGLDWFFQGAGDVLADRELSERVN